MKACDDARDRAGRSADFNLCADNYLIAITEGTCGSCGRATRLIGLILPAGAEVLGEEAMTDPVGEPQPASWERSSGATLLFYILTLPPQASRHLWRIAPAYRLADGGETEFAYWANHCEHCDGRFDDQDLFCEFDGAFVPTNSAAAAKIELKRICEPIAVLTAGAACDPPYLSHMCES